LVFIDETGIFLMPLVRRTWAPRGQTPVLHTRTRHHRHLSVIGAITVSPKLRRLGWYLRLHPDRSIRQAEVIEFLRDLLRHVRGSLVLLWDRLNAHRGRLVQEFLQRHPRLDTEHFPAYAPELNPNEYGWAHLKGHRLGNYCPNDLDELTETVQETLPSVTTNQSLLRGFIRATKLPLRIPRRPRA
jgi:transposase